MNDSTLDVAEVLRTRDVPPELARKLYGIDPGKPPVAAAKGFLSDARPFLVLAGPPGRGKSLAGVWALLTARHPDQVYRCSRIGEDGRTVNWDETVPGRPMTGKFVLAVDLTRAGMYDREFWARLEKPDLLVVDEVGFELGDGKGYALGNLLNLLAKRQSWERKTILTTNLPWEEFKQHYFSGVGERVFSRAREHGEYFFRCSGPDLRQKPAP